MATKQEMLAEAYKRGILPPEKAKMYEEAVNRGIIVAENGPKPSVGPIPETSQPTTYLRGSNEVTQDIQNATSPRVKKTIDFVNRQFEDGANVSDIPKIAAVGTGQAAGAVFDLIGTGVANVVKAVTPNALKDYGKEKIESFLSSPLGQKGLDALKAGVDVFNEFQEKHPDAAIALDSMFNIYAMGFTQKGAAVAEKEGKSVITDLWKLSKGYSDDVVNNKIKGIVKHDMPKAVRSKQRGKYTISQINKYFDDAGTAVEEIIKNKKNLALSDDVGGIVTDAVPTNLLQFSEAIDQTKRVIYQQYDELAKNADELVDVSDIVKDLYNLRISNASMRVNPAHASLPEYARKTAENLWKESGNTGKLTASRAGELLQDYNAGLKNFYANPVAELTKKNAIDAKIADGLRRSIDKAVMGHGDLRKKYGAMLSLEKEVNARMLVDMRKDLKGLLDHTDVFSGAQAVNAVAQANAPLFLASMAAKGIAGYQKLLKNPNRVVKEMFQKVESLYNEKLGFTPKSKTIATGKKMFDELKENKLRLNDLQSAHKSGVPSYKGQYYGPETKTMIGR